MGIRLADFEAQGAFKVWRKECRGSGSGFLILRKDSRSGLFLLRCCSFLMLTPQHFQCHAEGK